MLIHRFEPLGQIDDLVGIRLGIGAKLIEPFGSIELCKNLRTFTEPWLQVKSCPWVESVGLIEVVVPTAEFLRDPI